MSILSGSLNLNGNIVSSGDLTFSNTSSAVVQNVRTITPNGTSSFDGSSNTTSTLDYGINIIYTATSSSYCVKFPQPTTGKSVTVINKSGIDIKIFPSNAGGDINGGIDEYVSIPSDGTSYLFNCYENPLPGGWSVVSATGNSLILTSEAITSSLSEFNSPWIGQSFSASRHNVGFINNTMQATGSSILSSQNPWNSLGSSGGISQYGIYTYTSNYGDYSSFNVFNHQRPDNPWKKLNSIKIITNISSSLQDNIYFSLALGLSCEIYNAGTNEEPTYPWDATGTWNNPNPQWVAFRDGILTSWVNANPGNMGADIGVGAGGMGLNAIASVTPGTFTTGPDSPYLAASPGAPGTLKFSMNVSQNNTISSLGATNLGINFIGSFSNLTGTYDVYRVKHWGIHMGHYLNAPLPKVKLIPRYSITLS